MRAVLQRALLVSGPGPLSGATESTAASAPTHAADRPSFAELYRAHFDFIWRSLRHLGVAPASLDDAVQEVWLVVHRKLADFEARSSATTWLFGIALNVARSQRRRSGSSVESLSDELPSRGPDPENALVAQDAWGEVQSFLDGLPELQRTIFVSALLENMSPAETAEAIGVDVGIVYRRVRALRRAFQRRLSRREESSK